MLSGDRPERPAGNQLLSALFGAQLHYTGAHESHWGELMIAAESLTDELAADGAAPYAIPIGGSTADRRARLRRRVRRADGAVRRRPASSRRRSCTRRRAAARTPVSSPVGRCGDRSAIDVPEVLAIGVAKGVNVGHARHRRAGRRGAGVARPAGRRSSTRPMCSSTPTGSATTTPCRRRPATTAIRWAATHGGWVLDRTYTGKGLAGLLGNAAAGRWPRGADVIFVHTGGMPAVFAPGGAPVGSVCFSARLLGRQSWGPRSVCHRSVATSGADRSEALAFGHERDPRRRPARVRDAARPRQRRAVVDGVTRSLATGLRVHQSRPVGGHARHRLRHAPRVLRRSPRSRSSGSPRRAPTARPATPDCSSRPPHRATSPTGRRCSTGRRRSRPGIR